MSNITKKILTSSAKTTLAQQFMKSLKDNTYYVGFSKHVPYGIKFEYNMEIDSYSFSSKTDINNNRILIPNTEFSNGDRVRYSSTFNPVLGLQNNGEYFIVDKDNTGFSLSTTFDGTVVNITPTSRDEFHNIRFSSGKNTSSTTGDDIETPEDSQLYLKTKLYDDLIFSKRALNSDVSMVIKSYLWTKGEIYDIYDYSDQSLHLKKFYVIVDDISEYNVYKCLDNNNNSVSTAPPTRFGDNNTFRPFYTSDGYVWKYLYTISKFQYDKFSTTNFVPLIKNKDVEAKAIPGSVEVVTVKSSGAGYENHTSGTFSSEDIKYGGSGTAYGISNDSSDINGFYENCVIKLVSSSRPGVANQYRKILNYVGTGIKKFIIIDSPFVLTPQPGDTYQISPIVEIWGDGSQSEEALGRAIIDQGRINSVEMISTGRGYRNAVAYIRCPLVVSSSENFREAKLNSIVSPPYGHGGNIEQELFAKSVCISVKVEKDQNIPSNNDYRTISLIQNPKFTGVEVLIKESNNRSFSSGEKIIQAKPIKIAGTCETIEGSSVLSRTAEGKISNTISIAVDSSNNMLTGSGYDHRINPALIFDNSGTGGRNAAGTFVANTSYVKSKSFASNSAANGTIISNMNPHTFVVGDKVIYDTNIPGQTPVFGLIQGQYYYVVASGANTISLSRQLGGVAISVSNSRDFVYNISSNTVTITGADSSMNPLTYTPGAVQVIKNSTELSNSQFTQTNSSVITLSSNAVSGDTVVVKALTNSSSNSIIGVVNGSILSIQVTNTGAGYNLPPVVTINTSSGGSGASISASLQNNEITEYTQSLNVGDYVLIEDGNSRMISKVSDVINDSSFVLENTMEFTSSNASVTILNVTSECTLDSYTKGKMKLKDISKPLIQNQKLFGLSSMSQASILENTILINGRLTDFSSLTNLNTLIGNYTSDESFTEDERIFQRDDNIFSMPRARVFSQKRNIDNSSDVIYTSRSYGIFSREAGDRTIYTDDSAASFDLINTYSGDIALDSGEVLYIENIDPIDRSSNRSEQIKIILEFGN